MIIKVIILAALIRILLISENAYLCSGIYTGAFVFVSLLAGAKVLLLLGFGGVVFVLSSIYFHLLQRFRDNTLAFWLIACLGILIGFV